MRFRATLNTLVLAIALVLPFSVADASQALASPAKNRTAIVLASFGSTVEQARAAEADFVRAAKERYPETHVVLANTARMVLRKNAEQGVIIPSLFRVLADLADAGYTHVAVQSLQLIPGAEFDGVAAVARSQAGLPKGIKKISVGAALLAANADCERLAAALPASLPKERAPSEPAIFVGHGTHHGTGGMVYPALQWHAARHDARLFISTIEGTPAQEDTLTALGKPAGKKNTVWLAPLLTLAGDHAVNDLYGDEDDSWEKTLTRLGWQVRRSPVPLLAVPEVRELFFAHLDAALGELR